MTGHHADVEQTTAENLHISTGGAGGGVTTPTSGDSNVMLDRTRQTSMWAMSGVLVLSGLFWAKSGLPDGVQMFNAATGALGDGFVGAGLGSAIYGGGRMIVKVVQTLLVPAQIGANIAGFTYRKTSSAVRFFRGKSATHSEDIPETETVTQNTSMSISERVTFTGLPLAFGVIGAVLGANSGWHKDTKWASTVTSTFYGIVDDIESAVHNAADEINGAKHSIMKVLHLSELSQPNQNSRFSLVLPSKIPGLPAGAEVVLADRPTKVAGPKAAEPALIAA